MERPRKYFCFLKIELMTTLTLIERYSRSIMTSLLRNSIQSVSFSKFRLAQHIQRCLKDINGSNELTKKAPINISIHFVQKKYTRK